MVLLLPNLPMLLLACNSRRALLSATCGAATAIVVAVSPIEPPAIALDENGATSQLYLARPMGVSKDDDYGDMVRPSAPLQYLLPAVRVRLYVYRALAVAEDFQRSEGGANGREVATRALDGILLNPPRFVLSTDPSVSRGDPYVLPPILGELVVQRRKMEERRLLDVDVGLAPQLFEVGQLIGERRQWNRLSNEERTREGTSEVRRALNIYTTNINYDPNRYVYAGSREEKSRSIREGNLPTAGDVIRSDLDARDLYRNELQTSLDDARAEYFYQKGRDFEDVSELVSLLRKSRNAIDRWFAFVPDRDIREAMEVVGREEGQLR